MRTLVRPALVLLALAGLTTPASTAQGETQTGSAAPVCASAGTTYTRTTLYFGLARPAGTVTERQWKSFVRDDVTPRFPQGFTVWQADGQWRNASGHIARERAKVLLLIHENTAAVREAIAALVANYKRDFQQESVLWETATVCAAF